MFELLLALLVLSIPILIIIAIVRAIKGGRKTKTLPNLASRWNEFESLHEQQQSKTYTMSLVGWNYEGRDKHLRHMKSGDPILFVSDRNNKHDKFAVAIYNLAGKQIGFLKKESGGIKSFGEQMYNDEIKIHGKLLGFKDNWPYIEFAILK